MLKNLQGRKPTLEYAFFILKNMKIVCIMIKMKLNKENESKCGRWNR